MRQVRDTLSNRLKSESQKNLAQSLAHYTDQTIEESKATKDKHRQISSSKDKLPSIVNSDRSKIK